MAGKAWFGAVVCAASAMALQGAQAQDSQLFSMKGGLVEWGQAVGVTSIVFGPDKPSNDEAGETVVFTGLLKVVKSPLLKLDDGRQLFAVRFDSKKPNEVMAVRSAKTTSGMVKVAVNPDETGGFGVLVEIPAASHPKTLNGGNNVITLDTGHDHEAAEGHAALYLTFEPGEGWHGPAFTRLGNIESEPITLAGHLHHIPLKPRPIKLVPGMSDEDLKKAMSGLSDVDAWTGSNKEPVALRDENGQAQAWFTPVFHVTTMTGYCGDKADNDEDGKFDEESPNNRDDDGDEFVDEDSTCPSLGQTE